MERNVPFRLERVLEHRRRLTENAQQALAIRARERAEVEEALNQLQRERTELALRLERSLDHPSDTMLDLTKLVAADTYDIRLRAITERQERERVAAVAREADARAARGGGARAGCREPPARRDRDDQGRGRRRDRAVGSTACRLIGW